MPDLLPCPICGGTNTLTDISKHWTGKTNVVISARVQHWCEFPEGSMLRSYIEIKGKTLEEAINRWHSRA